MPSKQRTRPQKTAILIAQRIVAEITDHDLPPGTLLAPEREMIQRYGVARGTLREALRFLEMQGVLTMKPGPGGGPVVNGADARALGSAIALLLHLEGAHFSVVVATRELLEPATARKAAKNAKRQDLANIRATVDEMDEAIGDYERFFDSNRAFHRAIGRASGNQLYDLLLGSLSWIIDGSALGVEYNERRQRSILAAHEKIYEALAAGDEDAAEETMRDHIDEFARYIGRHYKAVLDSPLRWDASVSLP